VLSRTEPTLDIAATPAGVPEHWSARWTGTLTAPETGRYRLSLLAAGIVRLSVDGRLLRTAYREATRFVAGPHYPVDATVDLTAGETVALEVAYSSAGELFGASVRLAWQRPSHSGIPAAVEVAADAGVAVVLANEAQGEGMDRTGLALPGDQDELIAAVARANPRTVVVLNTGGPVLMPWLDDVAAVVQSWYPGQAFGAALAAVLFGDEDPGGRLPVTFPASDDQGPAPAAHYDEGDLVGHRWYDATGERPLFPFGFGLSYADFALGRPEVRRGEVGVPVRNVGDRAGSTVVQLYADGLQGYEKVTLDAGEATTVRFRVDRRGTVRIGTSSADLPLRVDVG
jgi:beta-glucosidase